MVQVSSIPTADDVLDAEIEVIPAGEVAERLGVPVSRVHQAFRDGHLIAVRRQGVLMVPACFITEDDVVKGLSGTLTVLLDSGFTHTEMLRWLFESDDSLPGTPIEALRGDRGKEIKRRAQALAF